LVLAPVLLQAFVRPEASLLSLRDDSSRILGRISGGRETPWPVSTGVTKVLAPDYRCGSPTTSPLLEPRISEIVGPLRWAAERIYQGDLLDEAVGNLSPWQVRLWQLRYGVGLWSGRLDDGPVTARRVEEARGSAMYYYRMRLRQVACDTARGLR